MADARGELASSEAFRERRPAATAARPPEELQEVGVTGQRRFSSLKLFNPAADGPLAALEVNNDLGSNTLTYPQDLGNNEQYRYVMRMLIFKQRRDVNALPIIAPNTFDRTKKAAQEGRINNNILNPSVNTVVGAAIAGATIGRVIQGLDPTRVVSKAAGELGSLAVAGTQLAAAGVTAKNIDSATQENKTTTEPQAYINLYMPDGLNFVDRHDYDSVSVTDALGNLGALGTGSTTEIAARIGESASIAGISLLGQNVTDLALYNSGYALNPQLQVLFKGSKNREFVFTFRFIPRNPTEAETIESIIRTLRYHAAPNYQTDGKDGLAGSFLGIGSGATNNSRYFIPPSQFEIEFLVMTKAYAVYNDKLPRIAQCALTNIDVNYAPSGQFAAYADYQPVETQLQLTFTETVVLTKQDIQVGY